MSNDMMCRIQIEGSWKRWRHSTYSVSANHLSSAGTFGTLEDAILWHNTNCNSEYGLTVDFDLKDVPIMTDQQTLFQDLVVETFSRKVFEVQAIQVTESNLVEVAKWCKGEVLSTKDGVPFVGIPSVRQMKAAHNRAFVGFWVATGKEGYFSCYSDRAFKNTFEAR